MPLDPVTLGIASSVVTGIFGGGAARRAKRKAQREVKRLSAKLNALENSRQAIINPYEGITDLSGMAVDRSSQFTNAYNNLSVATQAAEMQAQQTDLSLASTLDTLRATGAGAGGATALAQAALRAKQGVSASIAQQEARNEQLRAQGEARLQQQLADAEVKGRQFVFGATERREMQQLNRLSALAGAASQQAAAAGSAANQMFGQALGGVAGFALQGGFNNLNLGGNTNNTSINNNSSSSQAGNNYLGFTGPQ